MGLYIIYKDAIRILVPRDLHIGSDEFETKEPGEEVTVEIRKSRFQIQDQFILSIGVLVSDPSILPKPSVNLPMEPPLLGNVGE